MASGEGMPGSPARFDALIEQPPFASTLSLGIVAALVAPLTLGPAAHGERGPRDPETTSHL